MNHTSIQNNYGEKKGLNKQRKKYRSKFLLQLIGTLNRDLYPEFIGWSTDGSAVEIRQPTQLAEIVLPQLYRHSNINSFLRQINMYKFQRSFNKEKKTTSYSHPLFQRNRLDLLEKIERTPVICKSKIEENQDSEDLEPKSSKKGLKINPQTEYTLHNSLSADSEDKFFESQSPKYQNECIASESSHFFDNQGYQFQLEEKPYQESLQTVGPVINFTYLAQIAAKVNETYNSSIMPVGFDSFRKNLEKLLGFDRIDQGYLD